MEAELTASGRADARPRGAEHAGAARWPSARATASAARDPFNRGLFHTGCERRPDGQGRADRSTRSPTRSPPSARATTAARRGAAAPLHGRQRAADVRARRAARRAAGGPAVARPGREHRPLLDVPLDVHAGLGPYGIAWPVIHQQLGVRPSTRHRQARDRAADAGRPARASAASDIRLGDGVADVQRAPQRQPLHDDHDGRADRGRDRRCASGRRSRRARRPSTVTLDGTRGAQADRARDPPRRRSDREGALDRQARRGREFVDVLELAR